MCLCVCMFLRPQPYRSLKEAQLVEEGEEAGAERFQGNTAPPSPVQDKFSELNLLEDSFSGQPGASTLAPRTKLYTHVPLGPARSLEELSSVCETQEQQANFSYQVTTSLSAGPMYWLPDIGHYAVITKSTKSSVWLCPQHLGATL